MNTNKLGQKHMNISIPKKDEYGMSLIEVVISITLLSIFFTIYTGFVSVSSRFNSKEISDLNNSNGLTIDNHYLSLSLDRYASFLSQPGVTLADINTIKQAQIGNLPMGCTLSPNIDWQIPISQKPIIGVEWQPSNANYAICLKSSSLVESQLTDLVSLSKGNSIEAKPGIYFLLALPKEISINSLPMRKIFCRPLPYC